MQIIAVYNADKKKLYAISLGLSPLCKWMYPSEAKQQSRPRIAYALTNKKKLAPIAVPFEVALRVATKAQEQMLGNQDFLIIAD